MEAMIVPPGRMKQTALVKNHVQASSSVNLEAACTSIICAMDKYTANMEMMRRSATLHFVMIAASATARL